MAKAIMLPLKEIDPMKMPSAVASASPELMCAPDRVNSVKWAISTSAAVPPPIPLKSATICGMAVICTVRAK